MGFEPTTLRVLEGRGFESHLRLRFFLCPLLVDSLPLSFLYNINISGISIVLLSLFLLLRLLEGYEEYADESGYPLQQVQDLQNSYFYSFIWKICQTHLKPQICN